jgi:hypothetical protein
VKASLAPIDVRSGSPLEQSHGALFLQQVGGQASQCLDDPRLPETLLLDVPAESRGQHI